MAALTLTASGCVTVHGERAVIPAATEAEAARALKDFLTAYNKADRANDPALDADRVTGALASIDQAGLRARRSLSPGGNRNHSPLRLTDVRYAIPAMAGWPKFFLADTDSDRDVDGAGGRDTRWLLGFTKSGPDARWKAAYLTILNQGQVPALRSDDEGAAVPVPLDDAELTLKPGKLSKRYTDYLSDGGSGFAAGPHTDQWRAQRERDATRPGLSRQYQDQPLDGGAHAPVGVRTEDGGALVLFGTRHFEKRTVARGRDLKLLPVERALLSGTVQQSVTLEYTSNQAVRVPPRKTPGPGVEVLSRVQGLTGTKGG
ncbi:hypothetical protein JNUCC64_25495 [Streptomyces sp. JNUCC 64]